MKPTNLMRQMKTLLPRTPGPAPSSWPCSSSACLPRWKNKLIAKDFKDCTLMVELYSSRASCTIATINTEYDWKRLHQCCFRRAPPGNLAPRSAARMSFLESPGAQPPEDPQAAQGGQWDLLLPHHIRRQGQEMQAWLPVDRKRPGRRELNALGGCMIFLQDD